MPVVARAAFADEAAGLGYLMAAIGVGALGGALALSMKTPGEKRSLLLITGSLFVNGAALTAVAAFRSGAAIMALLFVYGASMIAGMALCNTTIQRRLPDSIRGRVLSMYTFAFFAAIPFGNLAAGLAAEKRGIVGAVLILGGGVLGTGVLAALILWMNGKAMPETRESPQSSIAGT
jgi:predicted MFS family arabinose efflux permease